MRITIAFSRLLAVTSVVVASFSSPAPVVAQPSPKPPPIRVGPAKENALTPRQLEIIRIARAGDGYITEDLHREFWAGVPFDPTVPEARKVLRDLSNAIISPAQKLGYETWVSARLSLRAGRVVRSEGLDASIEEILGASDAPGYRDGALKSITSVDSILVAAANGTPLQTAFGPRFINEDLIDATLAGIEGGTRRAEILFNPVWELPLEYYRYPKAKVAVLAPWAFSPEKSEFTAPNGVTGELLLLSRAISENQNVAIGFSDFSKEVDAGKASWPDPDSTVRRNVEASLRNVGANPIGVTHSEGWRGYSSGVGSGWMADATDSGWVSTRSVYLPEHKGFLFMIAFSGVSLADSQRLLDELETNAQILR